jgi:hypothetical protein
LHFRSLCLVSLCALYLFAIARVAGGAESSSLILSNGDFEVEDSACPGKPAGWDKPDGLGVQWVVAAQGGKPDEQGRGIRMDTSVSEADMVAQWQRIGITKWDIPNPAKSPVAATYGLSYYSDAMPAASGQAYRVSFRFKGKVSAKVWVRGYGRLGGEERRLYDTIVNCHGAPDWTDYSQFFHPTARTPAVTTMRVMLYAYWPPGVCWYDDVKIEPACADEWRAQSGR